jgi:hypothetical protein
MLSSSLPSSISPVLTFSTSMSFKAWITLSQRYSSSFFLSNLSFWILRQNLGQSLQNPEKTAEKSEFRFFLDEPVLQNPEKLRNNPRFEIFLGPLKITMTTENPNFETCSSWENCEEFLDKPILQNPKTPRKNPRYKNFLGPLKIERNHGKIQIL